MGGGANNKSKATAGGKKKHPQQQKGFKGGSNSKQQKSKENNNTNGNTKKNQAPAIPQEKYVVLVHNVENSLELIHKEAVARHLGLNLKLARTGNASGNAAASAANFDVTVRTETHSAQVDMFYDDEVGAEEVFNAPIITSSSNSGEENAKTEDSSKRGKRSRSVNEVLERAKGKRYFGLPLKTRASTSGKRAEDNANETEEATGGALAVSSTNEAMHSSHIVGVGCTTNVALGAKQLHNILTDIPGFISCWKGNQPKKFRCVFESEQVVFSGKQLLDQFEVEGVKITLNIPDSLTDRFNDFVAARTE